MAASAAGLSLSLGTNMRSMLHLTGVDGREQCAYHAMPLGGIIVSSPRTRPQLRVRCTTHVEDVDAHKSHDRIHSASRRTAKKIRLGRHAVLHERTAS